MAGPPSLKQTGFVDVVILNVATGVQRTYPDPTYIDEDTREIFGGADHYMWTEGNYACDCNRALFFARAGGEPEPDNTPCGETRFKVISPKNIAD